MEQTVALPCIDGTERTIPVLNVDEVIALEQQIAEEGTSLYELMQRAGHALAKAVQETVAEPGSVVILAGSGNNGGDGWVAAQALADAGYRVTVISKTDPADLTAEPARTAALEAKAKNSFAIALNPNQIQLRKLFQSGDLIIDAILGTGFAHSEVRSPYAEWIEIANAVREESHTPVISADCPSGLNAQTGNPANQCITADITVTMLASKRGLLEPTAQSFVGKLVLAPLVEN